MDRRGRAWKSVRVPAMRVVTWSPSVTLTLTHDCPWLCAYCGFRTEREGLVKEAEVEAVLAAGRAQGALEVLLISGEHPGVLPHIGRELRERGYRDFVDFAVAMARRVVEAGMLGHGNYGALSIRQLERLRPWHVSMGLMLENVVDDPAVAPEKRAAGRLATIEAAGKLRIPFTTGILIGLGESEESRVRSLEALAELHHRYGHLQELLIQNFVPNGGSLRELAGRAGPGLEVYEELIERWGAMCPDVPVQIPPNLNPYWKELLVRVGDLGGISSRRDEVNPTRPWAPEAVYEEACGERGVVLLRRLAVHERFIDEGWIDAGLLPRVRELQDQVRGVRFPG